MIQLFNKHLPSANYAVFLWDNSMNKIRPRPGEDKIQWDETYINIK